MPKNYAGFDQVVYTDDDQTIHTRGELMHYGRLGMKWYQHIFGSDLRTGRYGRNSKNTTNRKPPKAGSKEAKAAQKAAKIAAKNAAKSSKPLTKAQQEKARKAAEKQQQAEMDEKVRLAKEAAKRMAKNIWAESSGDIQKMRQRLIDQRQLKQLVEEETSPLKAMAKKALKNSGQRAMEQVLNFAVDAALGKLRSNLNVNQQQNQGGNQGQQQQQKKPKMTQQQYQNKVDDLVKSITADDVKKKKNG